MAELYIKNLKSGSSYVHWNGSYRKITTPSLCYYKDKKQYLPLIEKSGYLILNGKYWTYSSSLFSTICVRYNGKTYVVPNNVEPAYAVLSGSITSTSTSRDKEGSGSYSQTIKVSYKVDVSTVGHFSGEYRLSFSVTQTQGMAYSKTIGGTESGSIASGSVSKTATCKIKYQGGNSSATVSVRVSLTDSKNGTELAYTTVNLTSPWTYSTGGGGSSEE